MDRAAFLLLFSGVGLGWQPMPDGTNRYEYIVQVEPELLATLSEGQSIPIVGDVPEHIHPVARVRVVVGRGPAPRQQLVTLMKPIDGAATTPAVDGDNSIKLAQFYGSNSPQPSGAAEWNAAAGRYGAPAPTTPATSAPPVTPTYQPSAAANEAYSWNGGETAPTAASGPLAEVGQGLQDAAQPLRDGLNKVDDRVRSAFDKVGDSAKEVFDELGRPLRGRAAAPVASAPAAAPEWNAPPATSAAAPSAVQPGASGAAGSAWNQDDASSSATVGTQPTPRYGSAPSAAWPAQPSAPSAVASPGASGDTYDWNATGAAGSTATADVRGGAPANSAATPQDDPWARANPRLRSGGGSVAAANQPGATPTSLPNASATGGAISGPPAWSSEGPQLPPARGDLAGSTGVDWNTGSTATPAPPLGIPPIPAIGKTMLDMPATRPLEGVDPAASGVASNASATPDAARPPSAARLLDAASHDWDTRTASTQTKPAATTAAATPPTAGRDNTIAVLAAWVLLTGSIAGNLYLFWSYLDVRQKYRALVRKTARAVGSRFSAA